MAEIIVFELLLLCLDYEVNRVNVVLTRYLRPPLPEMHFLGRMNKQYCFQRIMLIISTVVIAVTSYIKICHFLFSPFLNLHISEKKSLFSIL